MHELIGEPPVLANGTRVPIVPATRAGNMLFLSGQLGLGDDGALVSEAVEGQARQCLKRLEDVLKLAGGDLSHIVKANIWVTHKQDFPAVNAIWAETFGNRPPARSTVVSELLIPGARIEVDAIAVLPK